ncbi:metallophosphoesterase [Oceanobacillus zhaokaii]|uniref:Metallophosphoesterase n=2 Tax=Oceanobacillus zhaokaii TaxID=2052660 RepID=A0A345PLM9_9BACI|nr:metallophosphoesterase [Oceanobacillus zhaokaii]
MSNEFKQKKEKTSYFSKYIKNRRILFIFGILTILGVAMKVYFDTNVFKVNRVSFQNNKLPSDSKLTILQISDLHNKVFGSNNETVIDTVEQANADIIVLTGDLIDRGTDDLDYVFSLVERITASNPYVFFVSGNHEWGNDLTEAFIEGLEQRNVTILNNTSTEITIGSATIYLAGANDVTTNHENLNLAFEKVNQESYTILLSHSPSILDKYKNIPADLVLSGHTHGGQVRLPLIGALVAPDQGFFPELEKGTYEFGENQFLYIDSGLGTTAAPIRFFNQSQVSLIEISGEK